MKTRLGWFMRLGRWGLGAMLISSAPLWAWSKADIHDWQATDLDATVAHLFINNGVCSSTAKYFLSCVEALKKVGVTVDPSLTAAAHYDFEAALRTALTKQSLPEAFVLGQAINAHLQFFDAHASLQPTQRQVTEDHFAGVGVELARTGAGLSVHEVIADSPAEQAQIQVGDLLLAAGDTPALKNLTTANEDEAQDTLRGPEGSPVHLKLQRDGRVFEIVLRRANVAWHNVESHPVPGSDHIFAIKVRSFLAGETCADVRHALLEARKAGAQKYALDLRGNPGGSFEEGLCTSALFVGWQNLAAIRSIPLQIPEVDLVRVPQSKPEWQWKGGYGSLLNKAPTVVLVDAATASAAEAAAGSMQLAKAAWLVGARTHGKGSLQRYSTVPGHASLTLSATIGLYYFTNHLSDQVIGLEPDFQVAFGPNAPTPLREGDLYQNALPAQNAAWHGADADGTQVQAIEECLQPSPETSGGDKQFDYGIAILRSLTATGDVICHARSI